jgi:hypothetical protein
MFHWICPECGREIAPTVKECSVCDPASVTAEGAASIPAVDRAVSESVVAPEAAPIAAPASDILTALPADSSEGKPAPPEAVLSEPIIETIQIESAPAAAKEELVPIASTTPALSPDAFADRLAALAEQLRAGHIPYGRPDGTDPKVAVPPPVRPLRASTSLLPAAATNLVAAPASLALLPEPAPLPIAAQVPMGAALTPRPAAARWIQKGLAGPEQPSAGSIQAPLLRPPILAPDMADLSDYGKLAAAAARPVPPSKKLIAVDMAPRVTLPGPTLPRELTSLQAAGLGTILTGKPRRLSRSLPGWVVSFFVMVALLLTGFGVVFYTMPGILASSGPAPAKAVPGSVETPAAYPLAKYVEVTGFRFLVDFNKKSEIHYLVVNHSSALLNGMTIFVTLHSASAKAGQPPMSRFSFPAPNLGPFESREMSSPIEHVTRAADLPDWRDLRAEVEIGQ